MSILSNSGNLPSDDLALSEISERDQVWDNHRKNADTVAGYYSNTDLYNSYALRIDSCSQVLDFAMVDEEESTKLKLKHSKFCRVRNCPVCQWRRSLRWKFKAFQILPSIVEKYPKHRWIFLTLTVKNCDITQLRDTLQLMNKSWHRLVKRKRFPAVGWLRSTEVTRGNDATAHPHFHCLLLVSSSYFGGHYIKQAEWSNLWQSVLRVDYEPVVDVRALSKDKSPEVLIPEILKYATKASDLVADKDWFLEYTKQMHKLRCVSTGGVLKEYLSALENEPEDLIGKSDEEDENSGEDDPHLYFNWRRKEQKYRLKSD